MRVCRSCQSQKTSDEFSKGRAVCKTCRSEGEKVRYASDRSTKLSYQRDYYKKNSERVIAYNAARYQRVKESLRPMWGDQLRRTVDEADQFLHRIETTDDPEIADELLSHPRLGALEWCRPSLGAFIERHKGII